MPSGSFFCNSSGLSKSAVLASLFQEEKKESGSTPFRASSEEGDRSSLEREVLVEASEGPVAVEDSELARDMDSTDASAHWGKVWQFCVVFDQRVEMLSNIHNNVVQNATNSRANEWAAGGAGHLSGSHT